MTGKCPRCRQRVTEDYYGPCAACRQDMRTKANELGRTISARARGEDPEDDW